MTTTWQERPTVPDELLAAIFTGETNYAALASHDWAIIAKDIDGPRIFRIPQPRIDRSALRWDDPWPTVTVRGGAPAHWALIAGERVVAEWLWHGSASDTATVSWGPANSYVELTS